MAFALKNNLVGNHPQGLPRRISGFDRLLGRVGMSAISPKQFGIASPNLKRQIQNDTLPERICICVPTLVTKSSGFRVPHDRGNNQMEDVR